MSRKIKKEKYRFSIDDAKWYIVALILSFHILPMIVSFFGETGQTVLTNVFMMILNPIFMFVICCFYGARFGFEPKFPTIAWIAAVTSILLYYSFSDIAHYVASGVIYFVVYTIFAYAFTFTGSFIKRFL